MEERRKKIVVDRGLQFRYTLLNAILLLVFSLLAGLTIYYSIKFGLSAGQIGPYAEGKIYEVFKKLRFLFLIESVCFIIIAILLSIRISLRIAGPVYHLKQGMKEIMQGNYAVRLQVRKRDELKDLIEQFNQMAETLQQKTEKV